MNKIAKIYPYPLGALFVIILHMIDNNIINSIVFMDLLNSTMIVFSVLFGFLLTVSTLLYTIDTNVMRDLRSTDGYNLLGHYLKSAIYFSMAISIISLCAPIFQHSNYFSFDQNALFYIKSVFLILIAITLILSIRFIHVFINVVE